jgi:hypothetical protein
MKNMKNALSKGQMEVIGALLLIAVIVLPFFTFASSRNDIYVDGSKKSAENGSAANPYHTISEALKHANDRSDVHVAKGNYEDNIEIPEGVRVFGTDKNEVVIFAASRSRVVVSMKNNSEIDNVTIEKGNEGIWVKKNAKVSITECIVQDNKKDGIKIEAGSTKKRDAVSITDSIIRNNGRAGIFSWERRLVLMNNEISENGSDGVDLSSGSSAWIEKNTFKNNDGSGLKLRLDESDVWTKSNTYRGNKHDGLEVSTWGKAGRIDINKSDFVENKNFAISRISRGSAADSIWKGLTIQSNTEFKSTKIGEVSSIIKR